MSSSVSIKPQRECTGKPLSLARQNVKKMTRCVLSFKTLIKQNHIFSSKLEVPTLSQPFIASTHTVSTTYPSSSAKNMEVTVRAIFWGCEYVFWVRRLNSFNKTVSAKNGSVNTTINDRSSSSFMMYTFDTVSYNPHDAEDLGSGHIQRQKCKPNKD